MDANAQYLISKDDGKLQIPYSEYESLIEKGREADRIQQVKAQVLQDLQSYLAGHAPSTEMDAGPSMSGMNEPDDRRDQRRTEMSQEVSVEIEPDSQPAAAGEPAVDQVKTTAKIPPLKKDIEDYFNARDASGRLLNVFKQYYTCLNESCGGIVCVTMKDGILSLWNYDKWEEFAFVDIHEEELRFTMDSRYTEDLCSLEFCEVARLLAARSSFVATRVEHLDRTMLEVLTKAFSEVDLTAG